MKFVIVVVSSIAIALVTGWLTMARNVLRLDEKLVVSKAVELGEGRVAGIPKLDIATKSGKEPAKIEVINGLEHDFGTMQKDETKEHGFIFKNSGGSPTIIKLMQTSCKCTLSDELGKETILNPGQEKEIILSWKPKNYSKDFEQTAKIQTQDPDVRMITLKISGVVIQNVRPEPEVLYLNGVSPNEDSEFRFRVYGYRKQDFKILDKSWKDSETEKHFDLSSRSLTPEEIAAEKGSKTGELITVKTKAGLPFGRIQQELILKTNEEGDDATLRIPVIVLVRSSVRISSLDPEHIFVPTQNLIDMGIVHKEPVSTTLSLFVTDETGEDGEPLQMQIVEEETIPTDGIIATLGESKKIKKNRLFPLHVKIPSDQPAVSLQGRVSDGETGRIVIETNIPTAKRIEIFVKYTVVK